MLTYDGERLRVGPRRRAGVPDGDRRAAARARATAYARRDPRPLSADPAPRLRLQPRRAAAREGLPRRARARRHRGTCVTILEATLAADPDSPPCALAARARLPGHVPRRRPRPDRARARADRPRGDGRHADRGHDAARHPPARALDAARRAGLAARRVRRRDEGGGRREGARVDARRSRRTASAPSG